MELDLGVSETCLKAGLLLGVLQCARKGCSFRVTGVAPSHCCQACELACDDQADHDNQCVQMPLLGLSLETRSERGLLDFQHFGSQLRQLLEDKGPLHLNSLPHFWDTAYGSGAWAKTRPVKSARKACNTYSNGVKVLNQVVHLLEDPDDDSPELQQRCQADLEHFGSLSPEDIDILAEEFELVLRDLQVSTAIAQLPVQDAASLWRCRLTVQAEAAEDKEATPSLSPEPVEVAAYGRSAEEAFTMARLYLLSRLSRWDASKQLPRARLLEKLLQDFAGEMVTDEVDEDSLETCRRQLQELLQILEDLLMTPPSSFGSVWQLLARSWPRILAFCKDERSLVSLLRSARGCNKRPSLGVWCQMAEEAAFQLESPVLELFEDLLVEEEGAAGAYARQQIFSLLVEQREQMLQETERSSREQRVKVTWHLREASFGCTLAEPLKGKVDAVLLTNEQGSKFLCEALDDSRLVVRASSCRLEELPGALSRRLSCQLLATYATIAGRQREALRKLPRKEKASFCPELRGAIIDSWAAREGRPEDEATLQRCAQLLAEDPVQDDPSEELLGQLTSPQQEALRNAHCAMPRAKPFDNTAHERPLWLGHQFRTARSLAGDRTSPPELEAPSGSSELRLKPCKEHHREFWLPPMPKGQRDPLTPAVKELQRDYGTKNHVWGKPVTDYRSNGWYIENYWAMRSLRKSASEPEKMKQPWASSKQFQSCCVGGVGGGRPGRNTGLYEDSFAFWGPYRPPVHGLSQSDVTKEAEEIIKQKALERK